MRNMSSYDFIHDSDGCFGYRELKENTWAALIVCCGAIHVFLIFWI